MIVACDSCGGDFLADLIEDRLPGGGAVQSMSCPHCAAVYPVVSITERGLAIRDKLHAARSSGDVAAANRLRVKFAAEATRPI